MVRGKRSCAGSMTGDFLKIAKWTNPDTEVF
jgi:hypothetical protein